MLAASLLRNLQREVPMAFDGYSSLSKAVLVVGLVGFAMLPVGALGAKFGLWHFGRGFQLLYTGTFVSAGVAVLGIALLLFALQAGRKDVALPTCIGVAAAIVALAVTGWQYRLTTLVPPINDITTDLTDPPGFAATELRGGEPLTYDPQKSEAQMRGYPHLESMRSTLAPEAALARAVTVAQEAGWNVVASGARGDDLTVEAVATTFWFGFVDDIVVRVRPDGAGSLVDIRSASRVGISDLGANAARIDAYVARFGE